METFFGRYKNLLVLVLVVLAQVIGLAVQVRRPSAATSSQGFQDGQQVRLLRYWVVSIVSPPEKVLHFFGSGIRGIWTNYIDLRHTRQENQDLRAEIDRLRFEQAAMLEDARQGQRLQALLAFRQNYVYKTVPAQVIGTSGTDQSRVVYIDKGSNDGLKPDQPVITADGIVGKIRDVFPHTAQVLQINDQTSGAGVILETTRIRGILRGNVSGQPQIINLLPDDRIKPGERVVTSGGDQVFPRGLPVGAVERIVHDPDHDPYVDILIQPGANLSRLEEVLVITSMGDQMTSEQVKDLQTSEDQQGAAVAQEKERQKASEVLAERLPSVNDPNAPQPAEVTTSTGVLDTSRPAKPLPTIHPDRFTPNSVPPATSLTPGQGVPRTVTPPKASSTKTATEQGTSTKPASSGAGATPPTASPKKPATPQSQAPVTTQPKKTTPPVRPQQPPAAPDKAPNRAPQQDPPQGGNR